MYSTQSGLSTFPSPDNRVASIMQRPPIMKICYPLYHNLILICKPCYPQKKGPQYAAQIICCLKKNLFLLLFFVCLSFSSKPPAVENYHSACQTPETCPCSTT